MAKEVEYIAVGGRNMVHDALTSNRSISSLLVSSSSQNDPKIQEILKIAKGKGVSVRIGSPEQLDREGENHQGVIAFMENPGSVSLEEILKTKRDAFVLLLNRIDYEQNLGAILRSAWAAGVDAVVSSPNGVHELTGVVAKVSMGAAAYVPLIGMSLFQAIDLMKRYAIRVVGVEVGMGKIYSEANLRGGVAFLMGGESAGLSEPLIKQCDEFVNIPMNSGVASLNVSVASALVLFEKKRQEREK